jgi:heptosyltransferase-2
MPTNKLIVILPKWIGDTIMALPAIQYLLDNQIEPILIGKPWIRQLLGGFGKIELISLPQKKFELIQILKQIPVNHILIFPNSIFSAFAGRIANKKTYGFSNLAGKAPFGWQNFFIQAYGRRIFLSKGIKKPDSLKHETELFFYLTENCVNHWFKKTEKPTQQKLIPKLPLLSKTLINAKKILERQHISSDFIVICPFAHGLSKKGLPKKWPKWIELYEKIQHLPCVLCPGPNETESARKLFPKAIILENINLNTYAAILKLSKIVIANDSGPMHIAAAVEANVISLFGTTDPSCSAPKNLKVLGDLNQWPSLNDVCNELVNHHINIK